MLIDLKLSELTELIKELVLTSHLPNFVPKRVVKEDINNDINHDDDVEKILNVQLKVFEESDKQQLLKWVHSDLNKEQCIKYGSTLDKMKNIKFWNDHIKKYATFIIYTTNTDNINTSGRTDNSDTTTKDTTITVNNIDSSSNSSSNMTIIRLTSFQGVSNVDDLLIPGGYRNKKRKQSLKYRNLADILWIKSFQYENNHLYKGAMQHCVSFVCNQILKDIPNNHIQGNKSFDMYMIL